MMLTQYDNNIESHILSGVLLYANVVNLELNRFIQC